MVALGYELEHALVDGTTHIETEGRVKAIFHVGKVLVRQQLEQHGRHFRNTSLVVRCVAQSAPSPVRFIFCTNVVANLFHDKVGVEARKLARCTILVSAKRLAVLHGAIDAQCANDTIIVGRSGIGVEGQR